MVNRLQELDRVLHALSDPTRRTVLERRVHSPGSVSQPAQPLPMFLAGGSPAPGARGCAGGLLTRREEPMSDHVVTHATFTLERTYPVPPERVFDAWAAPQVKARWFAGNPDGYELDFRPGGLERNTATPGGKRITWEPLYREII